jgi:cellulose 1,4-beta-cellobiosidase
MKIPTPLLSTYLLLARSLANPIAANAACPEVSLNASTNVWKTLTLHPNSIYAAKVSAAAAIITDPVLKKKALKVAEYGTFLWL